MGSEKKIEIIEERLARIENLLENLTTFTTSFRQLSSAAGPSSIISATSFKPAETLKAEIIQAQHVSSLAEQAPPQPSTSSTNGDRILKSSSNATVNTTDHANANAAFEGASSLSAHSEHATRVIENAMNNDFASFHRDPEMQEALFALRHLIDRQNSPPVSDNYRFPNQQVETSSGGEYLSARMPPLESVVTLLRLCKGKRDRMPRCNFSKRTNIHVTDLFV